MSAIDTVESDQVYTFETQEEYPDIWTSTKTQRTVLKAFTALSLLATTATLTSAYYSIISIHFAWASIPLIILGIGAYLWARSTNDYDNPKELHDIRIDAHNMSFKSLYQKHGASNLARHIGQKEGPSINDLKNNFLNEESSYKKILYNYNIKDLAVNGFISYEHRDQLVQLKNDETKIKQRHLSQTREIDLKYPTRTDKLHKHVNTTHLVANSVEQNLIDDYEAKRKAQAVTSALAIAGHIGAEISGKDQQISYNREIELAKENRDAELSKLHDSYQEFRRGLLAQ
jgi:nitrogen fixation-related uncharacterized protein